MMVDVRGDANDRVLVECYAKEMTCVGFLSDSVSYGWALDAFLADPTEFRARVRSVHPPSQLVQNTSKATAEPTMTPPFSLARRAFSLKYRGVSWNIQTSKWKARITSSTSIGYFEAEDDAARAYDKCIHEHNLNIPLNARNGVLVARERGSVYQGQRASRWEEEIRCPITWEYPRGNETRLRLPREVRL